MYSNVTERLASAATASATFTTTVNMQNFDVAALQVNWTNLSHANATFRVLGSLDGTIYNNLHYSPVTFTSGSDGQLFNIRKAGYNYIQCLYSPGSATTGVIDVIVTRKSDR